MPLTQTEESKWAVGLASRLKLLQVHCADDAPAQRRELIADELKRALADVPAGRRKVHLMALGQHFPVWGPTLANSEPAPSEPDREQPTPEELLERLLAALPELSPDRRRELVSRVRHAGVLPPEVKGSDTATWASLRTALNTPADQAIDPERMAEALLLLLEALLTVHKFAWGKWSELAPPASKFRKPPHDAGELRRILGQYLTDKDPASAQSSRVQMEECFDKKAGRTVKLAVEMLVALHGAGMECGRLHLDQFSPDAIKDAVGGRGFFGNWKSDCWDKYVELFRPFSTREAIAKRIKDCFARVVELHLSGMG